MESVKSKLKQREKPAKLCEVYEKLGGVALAW
jgi:hypothetical protein